MKVQLCPADKGGCRFYRMLLPAKYMSTAVDVVVDDQLRAIRDHSGEVFDAVPADEDVDVVVLQRPMKRDIVELIPLLQARGVAVVVEMDDDLTSVPRANKFWRHIQGTPDNNHKWALKAARMADHVTVSTPALLDVYAPHRRATVIRNYIDDEWLEIPHVGAPETTLGWTGHVDVHPYDLEMVGKAFGEVVRETNSKGYIIGGPGAFEPLGLDGDIADFIDWMPIDQYPYEVSKLWVGVVPLVGSKFNESKSWLKGLEYAALGIPSVVSPRSEYELLAEALSPWVRTATKYKEWKRELHSAVTLMREAGPRVSDTLRAEVARDFVMSKHTHEYETAWRAARDHRGTTPKAPWHPELKKALAQ